MALSKRAGPQRARPGPEPLPAGHRRYLEAKPAELGSPASGAHEVKGNLTGILALGPKLTEEDYSAADIGLLTTVTSQAAILIENSRLYSQEHARLRELEQLGELKSNRLRTVSHELKSPVTAAKTSVELLGSAPDSLEERHRQRLMRTLHSGVNRLERLVQESLDYAQMQSMQLELHREPTDAAKLVEGVMELLAPSARAKRHRVTVVVPPDLPKLFADPQRGERILVNLVTNAINFTPPSGQISIQLHQEGSSIVTEVTDNGPGISLEEQEHVFEEYYRGRNADRRATSGSSLGLSIAEYLVELHGGRIGVRSQSGAGSTFYFTLPVVPTPTPEPASGSSTP